MTTENKIRTYQTAIRVRERIIEDQELNRSLRVMNLRQIKLKNKLDKEINEFKFLIKFLVV